MRAVSNIESDPPAGLTPEALESLFQAFSRTSREIERSHGELQAKVVELRKELAEKDRLLEQKKRLEALGLVVAGVAHEFRNPLGSLSLYVDCLSELTGRLPEKDSREAAGLITRIEAAVRHLDTVVEDMLIFTRAPASGSEHCDLERLVEEALLLLRSDIDGTGATCRIRVEPGLATGEGEVLGDRDQAVRAIVNVLKNAVQAVGEARPRGEGRIEITLGRGRERGDGGDSFVEVAVSDNGPGVPPERLERIFVPFYTEKQRGVGLGLYIVHSLLERQGGRVLVENRKSGGLRVRLQFRATSLIGAERGNGNGGRRNG